MLIFIHGISAFNYAILQGCYNGTRNSLINNYFTGDLVSNTNPYYVFIPRNTNGYADGILKFKINTGNNTIQYIGSINKQSYAFGDYADGEAYLMKFNFKDDYVYYPNSSAPRYKHKFCCATVL